MREKIDGGWNKLSQQVDYCCEKAENDDTKTTEERGS